MITATVLGSKEIVAEFTGVSRRVQRSVNRVTRTYGRILQTRIMAKASGRPGPNAPTGDYRRAWKVTFSREGEVLGAELSNDRPQRDRLEYGFSGTDSLGRVYNQPPYPHIMPAKMEVEPEYEAAVTAVLVALLP